MKKQITVRLTKEMIDKIDEIAKKETRTRNQQIEYILKNYIENLPLKKD